MSFECEFCKTGFTKKSNLSSHQKTTKYCLEIQKNSIDINNICEYCNKNFNTKRSLDKHLETCKEKEKKNKEKIKFELKDKDDLIKKLENELIKKGNELLEYKIENKYKNDLINKLEKELIKLENQLLKKESETSETNKYLLEKACSKNSINNNYNIQFNKLLSELEPFNEENIKSRIAKMNTEKIAYSNDKIFKGFLSNFSDLIKDLTFCTDASRGSLIVKDNNGCSEKITSKKFVLECFEKGKEDLINNCTTIHDFITDNPEINVFDQVKMRSDLATIITFLKENNLTSMVTKTANKIIQDCKHISKNNNSSDPREESIESEDTIESF